MALGNPDKSKHDIAPTEENAGDEGSNKVKLDDLGYTETEGPNHPYDGGDEGEGSWTEPSE